MTSKGVFSIDQKTFEVIDLKLSFSRTAKDEKKTAGNSQGVIKLRIDSSSRESEMFIPWVQDVSLRKDGEITYLPDEEHSLMKTFDFKKGRCVAYGERFRAGNARPLTAELTIAFEQLSCSETNIEERLAKLLK